MSFKGILNKGRVPVKIWSYLHEVESAALDQLTNISNLPFVFKHVAAMPDVHLGKGATVGSVVATKCAICPAAVGVESRKDEAVIDEIPGAYKDIDQVMENQKDLVRIVAQLKQIICIKG